jgi:hypothetical protein
MLGVEARSSPPEGLTRHLRPDALGQQSCVELLKRIGFARGHDGRTFKQILQIVIAGAVKSANGALFIRSLQLPVDTMVIGAAVCLDAKSAVGPQLHLGADAAGSAECQAVRLPGSDRSKESGRAVSRPGVSCPPPTAPAALPDASSAAHRVVGSKTRPAGALSRTHFFGNAFIRWG